MCLDRKHSWLLTGTQSGYLALWDLRFGLLLRTWRAGNGHTAAIQSITLHATKGKGRWVIVTLDDGDGFEIWDIGTAQCVERFVFVHDLATKDALRDLRRKRAGSVATNSSRQGSHGAPAVESSAADAIEQLLQSAENGSAAGLVAKEIQHDNPAAALHGFHHRANRPSIKAILTGSDYASPAASNLASLPPLMESPADGIQGVPAPKATRDTGWIISAGEDKRLVFWDLTHIEKSSLIVGADDGEEKAVYSREKIDSMHICTETRLPSKATSSTSKRQNLTAGSQQNVLKAHQDAITALALLELPFKCVISADRSGNVKVWE